MVKFVFFLKNGNDIIDASQEEPLSKLAVEQAFNDRYLAQYKIRSTAQLSGAKNLRKSFNLYVKGLVSQTRMAAFATALTNDWTLARQFIGK